MADTEKAYMLGHIDGIEGDVAALVPKGDEGGGTTAIFQAFFSRLRDELRAMHGTYGQWKGLRCTASSELRIKLSS